MPEKRKAPYTDTIELSARDLRSPLFHQALTILAGHQFEDPVVGFNVMRIIRRLETENKMLKDGFVKLVHLFAVKDENGAVYYPRQDGGSYEIPEDKVEDWSEAIREFEAIPIEINRARIPVSALKGAPLTPAHLAALEPLIEE